MDFRVIKINNIWMKHLIVIILDIGESRLFNAFLALKDVPDGTINHTQGREAQDIIFDKAHRL